ncbi:MAG: sulfate adenylyltransferase subunit CysN [Bacteroidia bacterium]|jgi:sulfate adenylyltransferase subunit 1|nr:sulfate adenylyltransferase subunit CysN [Bacteroidia bacterium]MBP7261098.1 sulfate adenylyltransferase subunit CysN [Bacteroidia bacterium]MBP9180247.1 sulfate adenylyltransferase subunit CysN [Bacteroidia bacterium]MBP9724360.1 sulfate adenylyltransferase subunit CysN [Bacteroidia bacterium]
MELLRFITCGNVDDGKSTLIGRLLYDSKAIFEDQLEAVKRTSTQKGKEYVDLSLLTDGLKAEREQGITIDVAYRYFATPKRKFIIADTPGHVQYTRNMVTGASMANLALVLIDARNGITEQTKRHSFIASLLGIPHLLVCVNKMDLVDYSEQVFDKIVSDFKEFSSRLDIHDIHFIPTSALQGDNIVDRSESMPWYSGSTLMYLLETLHINNDYNFIDARFPVQYVIRPHSNAHHDYRAFAGQIASGIFRKGDELVVLPSGLTTRVKAIHTGDGEVQEAFPPMSVSIELTDDVDISRGDMLVRQHNQPEVSQDIDVLLCWMGNKPLQPGTKFYIRQNTREVRGVIKEIYHKIDINTLHRNESDKQLDMNDIAKVRLRTTQPLLFDAYRKNRFTGSLILIDEATNETIAAGMVS